MGAAFLVNSAKISFWHVSNVFLGKGGNLGENQGTLRTASITESLDLSSFALHHAFIHAFMKKFSSIKSIQFLFFQNSLVCFPVSRVAQVRQT